MATLVHVLLVASGLPIPHFPVPFEILALVDAAPQYDCTIQQRMSSRIRHILSNGAGVLRCNMY